MVHDEATIQWLLDGDPAIRWQTERDLLDEPEGVVETTRALVATTGWGRELLDRQDVEGTWARDLYGPKWTSTAYTLLLLRRCGLARNSEAARRGVQLLWDGARYFDGGLTAAVTIDLPEACITSMYLALAWYFGFEGPRVDEAERWLLANQLPDGGWCSTNTAARSGSTWSARAGRAAGTRSVPSESSAGPAPTTPLARTPSRRVGDRRVRNGVSAGGGVGQ